MSERLKLSPENKSALSRVKAVIFDVDHTLAFAKDVSFFAQFGEMVEKAVRDYFDITPEQTGKVIQFYRDQYGGGEQALFMGNIHLHFPELGLKEPNWEILYDLLVQINPEGAFEQQEQLQKLIARLRSLRIKVVALTSSPDQLSKKILKESGYDPEKDFDLFIAYTRLGGPPKKLKHLKIFNQVAEDLNTNPDEIIAIGDSLSQDVMPAIELGMMGCLLTDSDIDDFTGIIATRTAQIIMEIIDSKTGENHE